MSFRFSGVLVLLAGVAFGQTETPDIGQLKTKLQQLEQMMQEVREQIAAVEAAQKTPGQPFTPKTTATPEVPTPVIP